MLWPMVGSGSHEDRPSGLLSNPCIAGHCTITTGRTALRRVFSGVSMNVWILSKYGTCNDLVMNLQIIMQVTQRSRASWKSVKFFFFNFECLQSLGN